MLALPYGNFSWIDGTTYLPETAGEFASLRLGKDNMNENCVEVYTLGERSIWNDKDCNQTLQFICKVAMDKKQLAGNDFPGLLMKWYFLN